MRFCNRGVCTEIEAYFAKHKKCKIIIIIVRHALTSQDDYAFTTRSLHARASVCIEQRVRTVNPMAQQQVPRAYTQQQITRRIQISEEGNRLLQYSYSSLTTYTCTIHYRRVSLADNLPAVVSFPTLGI